MARTTHRIITGLIGLALVAAAFTIGRLTIDSSEAGSADYYAGLRRGESKGLQKGRALQLTDVLPHDARKAARAAFDTGYAAGANDAFGGYDGGWYVSRPYLITLAKGNGPITYDVSSRTMLHSGTDYYLCPDSHKICQRHHH